MNKIAILGFPVKHSLSPKMHNYWLKTMKIKGEYKTIETNKNNLKKTVKKLCQQKYVGLNLTIPLKEEVVKFLNKKDKVVNTIGAVNTLIFYKGKNIEGKNTDVYGFKESLKTFLKNKTKKQSIIIGSGGAARAVLCALIEMKFEKIIICNRTKRNAERMKKNIIKNYPKYLKTKIVTDYFNKIEKNLNKTDLLINTTPLGMKKFPKLSINLENMKKKGCVYDLVYNPLETKLLKDAKNKGIAHINGLDMLMYQAQKSFYYWFKKKPRITNKLKKMLEGNIK